MHRYPTGTGKMVFDMLLTLNGYVRWYGQIIFCFCTNGHVTDMPVDTSPMHREIHCWHAGINKNKFSLQYKNESEKKK